MKPQRAASGQDAIPPLRRAHRSLWILIGVMILTAGALGTSITAAPSPLSGLGFALSSVVFTVALVLAGRVVIALERARRMVRPPVSDVDPFPLFSQLFRRTKAPDARRDS